MYPAHSVPTALHPGCLHPGWTCMLETLSLCIHLAVKKKRLEKKIYKNNSISSQLNFFIVEFINGHRPLQLLPALSIAQELLMFQRRTLLPRSRSRPSLGRGLHCSKTKPKASVEVSSLPADASLCLRRLKSYTCCLDFKLKST
jgi:hypothetical protein